MIDLTNNAAFEADIPHRSLTIKPFFHVDIPLDTIGMNASYAPARLPSGKLTMILTPEADSFKHQMGWLLRDQNNIRYFDFSMFTAISNSSRKVPFEVEMTFHLKSLWKKDEDGPIKIVQDVLFEHFRSLASRANNWNDNRVIALHVYKDITTTEHASIEIKVSCTIIGK